MSTTLYLQPSEFAFYVKKVEDTYLNAVCQDEDLWGLSILDLMADQYPNLYLDTLKELIVMSDISKIANSRHMTQIVGYARQLNIKI